MANTIFSEQIKKIRSNSKLTMEQFADKLGVTKSSVSMWENSNVVPREEVLRKIAVKFNISIDKLLGISVDEVDNPTLRYIHRNLEKLDEKKLEKAEKVLRTVFDDIFDDEEDEDDGYWETQFRACIIWSK